MSPADGLAEFSEDAVPTGTVLAYSAGPRQLAPDNGVFAQALATHMQQEGVELRQVLERVRRDVTQAAPSLNPTHTIALNTAPFYFRGAPTAPPPAALTYVSPNLAPDARQTPPDVRAPLVRGEDVSRLRDFALFRECELCPEMVVIPAGQLLMGSPQDEVGRDDDEDDQAGPGGQQVLVNVRRFAIGRFEVTAAEWFGCVDGGGDCVSAARGRGQEPVAMIRWFDAQFYIYWLSQQRSGGRTLARGGAAGPYRMPTEAEWEYAARAGAATRYSWGDQEPICDEAAGNGANHLRSCGESEARVVGSFASARNRFGLYDMHGGLYEFVQDCYADSYVGLARDGSAYDPEICPSRQRVIRGGSWRDNPNGLRSANRYFIGDNLRGDSYGVRIARTL